MMLGLMSSQKRLASPAAEGKTVRPAVPITDIVSQLHRILRLLDLKPTIPVQVGDLVQIAPNANDAYQGLPGVVQHINGYAAMVSILSPHRGGARHRYPLGLLIKIGPLQANPEMARWCHQIEKIEEAERQDRRVVQLLARLYTAYRSAGQLGRVSTVDDAEILKLVENHIDLSKLPPRPAKKPRPQQEPKPMACEEDTASTWERDVAILRAFSEEGKKLRAERAETPAILKKKPMSTAGKKKCWLQASSA